ncbi:hypothetical protein [Nocardia sp. NRRL S-836]|uniref:hypothetical protein n=1 Tax=Nocardia sp. NRRL S-836 TaxID=1519492 RepID=UPI0006AFC99D|nr:hypothetical protein [Nocardia sp. NRRL S-836]KOV81055.1 hypothetical protein ADL03_29975 [Nocardia sp. NRRL S-836]
MLVAAVVVVVTDVGSAGFDVDELVVVVGFVTTGGGSSVVTVVVVPSGRVIVVTRVGRFVVVVVADVVVSDVVVVTSTEDEVGAEVGTMLSASRTASLRGCCCVGASEAESEPAASEATAAKTVASTTPEAARTICGAPRKRERALGSGLSYTKFPLLEPSVAVISRQ